MAVNVRAPFALTRELLPLLRAAAMPHDPARILNIGSIAGSVVENIGAYSYAASKAALHHLSRVLAAELAGDHIAVNVIAPGYFPTRMTAHIERDPQKAAQLLGQIPFGRLGVAEDISGLCIFLASAASAYMTGTLVALDGGLAGCRG
jgi:NAD(P)-dependent dehydrogenase (short-subunit alcohol dehydrogenase family)